MTTKTTDLCDADDTIQVCELPFASYGKKKSFSGTVRTARFTNGLGAIRELVNETGNGHVLVIDAARTPWRAVFGDVMAALAVRNGWEGVVINGLMRDCHEINEMDIGVKALGTIPRRANVAGASERDIPLQFGGCSFATGDYLVADEDGVIVLPPGKTDSDYNVEDVVAATASYVGGTQP